MFARTATSALLDDGTRQGENPARPRPSGLIRITADFCKPHNSEVSILDILTRDFRDKPLRLPSSYETTNTYKSGAGDIN